MNNQERQALITRCQKHITWLKDFAFNQYNDHAAVQEEIDIYTLAKAALEAPQPEPVASFILVDGEYQQLAGEYNESPDAIPLYTSSPAIHQGWKLVPVEPNWEMLSADGCKEHHNGQTCAHHDNRKRIWNAMLTAAPAP